MSNFLNKSGYSRKKMLPNQAPPLSNIYDSKTCFLSYKLNDIFLYFVDSLIDQYTPNQRSQ